MKKTAGMTMAILMICVLLPVGCKSRTGVSAKKNNTDTVVTDSSARRIYPDKVVEVADRTISYGACGDGWGVICNGELFIDDPTVALYSVSPSVYAVDLVGRRREFDLTGESCLEQIRDFGRPLSGFNRFSRSYTSYTKGGMKMSYEFVADFPDSSVAHRAGICDWIVGEIAGSLCHEDGSVSHYRGSHTDVAGMADFVANDYFESSRSLYGTDTTGIFSPIGRVEDWRARSYNGRYVTYRMYSYDDMGGAHGLYCERLFTYDLLICRVVTNDVLISQGCEDKVVDLIYDALVSDSYYREWHDYPNADEGVKKTVEKDFGTGGQAVGLTDDGVVFSFQPYEVGCFAEGCHHITVPYDKLRPYLRPEALALIGL